MIMEKITIEFEWYRAYNPLEWNIFVIDKDWEDLVFLKRRKIPSKLTYKNKEDFISNQINGNFTKGDR